MRATDDVSASLFFERWRHAWSRIEEPIHERLAALEGDLPAGNEDVRRLHELIRHLVASGRDKIDLCEGLVLLYAREPQSRECPASAEPELGRHR